MTNKNLLILFINQNTPEVISDYRDKLYENLKALNSKEEKYTLWILVIFLLYILLNSSSIPSFTIGPATINNPLIITEIIPIVFVFIFFKLHLITSYKRDINLAIETISIFTFKQFLELVSKKPYNRNFIFRMYTPHSFLNSISEIIREKAHFYERICALILLFPIVIIAFVPYIFIGYMIVDLYKNHFGDILGKVSFFMTFWIFVILLYHLITSSIQSEKEQNELNKSVQQQ